MAKRQIVASTESSIDRDALTFASNIDKLFPATAEGGSRGQATVGTIRELERKPVAKRVYLTLVTMAIQAKVDGYTDKAGVHHKSGGAVMNFKLAEALEGVSLEGHKLADICDELVSAKLIRGGRTKENAQGKTFRLWFVTSLLDSPMAAKKSAEPSGVTNAVDALMALFAPKA